MNGKELKELRVGLGITQEQAAKYIGRSHRHISHIENETTQAGKEDYENYLTSVRDGKLAVESNQNIPFLIAVNVRKRISHKKDGIVSDRKVQELKAMRISLGISQIAANRAINRSTTYVSQLEIGKYTCPRSIYDELMEFYKSEAEKRASTTIAAKNAADIEQEQEPAVQIPIEMPIEATKPAPAAVPETIKEEKKMTNREAFDKHLHDCIDKISAFSKPDLLRYVWTKESIYKTELNAYAKHCNIDIYDVVRFDKWLDEDASN